MWKQMIESNDLNDGSELKKKMDHLPALAIFWLLLDIFNFIRMEFTRNIVETMECGQMCSSNTLLEVSSFRTNNTFIVWQHTHPSTFEK